MLSLIYKGRYDQLNYIKTLSTFLYERFYFIFFQKSFHICNKWYQNFCCSHIIGVIRYFHFLFYFYGASFSILNKRIILSNPIIILFIFGCSDHSLGWTRRILDSFGGQFALLEVNIGFKVVKSLSSNMIGMNLYIFPNFLVMVYLQVMLILLNTTNFSCGFIFYCSLWVTSGYAAGCYS